RKRALHGDDIIAVETECVGEPQPAFNAAFFRPDAAIGAVMVEDSLDPLAAQATFRRATDECCVLARHGGLITVSVQCPGLHLALVELARVQHAVKRMLVVVALRTDLPDRGLQLRWSQRGAHNRNSMPSKPTSQPARSTKARSGLAASRTGFELLMC